MDRCVRSGLWVADASTLSKSEDDGKDSEANAETKTEALEAKKEESTATGDKNSAVEEEKLTSEFEKQDLTDTKHDKNSEVTDAAKGDLGV